MLQEGRRWRTTRPHLGRRGTRRRWRSRESRPRSRRRRSRCRRRESASTAPSARRRRPPPVCRPERRERTPPATLRHGRERSPRRLPVGPVGSPREPTLVPMKRIALLGATGSIGRQALEVIEAHPELERGVELALANKESLVAAGELALEARERGGGRLIPVDSEHSAAFQCLEGCAPESIDTLVLTASGGPFRGRTRDELEDVTPEEALAHPTWSMGPKITVDSATLANKGLELIEAHFLFALPYARIEVVVHPSAIVLALVRLRDGAALAHHGYPDMRIPISYALTYPERTATPVPPLDLASGVTLEFHAPDLETFSLLSLAREAGERGGTYPCAFNAANEVAVAAFLDGRLSFLGIADVVADALAAADGGAARDLDDLVEADAQARRLAERGLPVA